MALMAALGHRHPTLLQRLLHLLLLLSTHASSPSSAARPIRDTPRPTREAIIPTIKQAPQLSDLIGTLTSAKEFNFWANLIAASNLSSLPPSATLFAPSDAAVAQSPPFDGISAVVLAYHIVPLFLPYTQLQLFDVGSRLPTLLSNCTIVVTGGLPGNLTLDQAPITHPDLYSDGAIAVHGIGSVLSPSLSDGSLQDPSAALSNCAFSPFKKLLDPLLFIPRWFERFLRVLYGGIAAEEF